MIVSMTGYGDASLERDGVSHFLEIRSLNNRYFKASIRVPEHLQFLETEIERMLRTRLGRGSISFYLRIRQDRPEAAYRINSAVLKAYVAELERIAGNHASVTMDLGTMLMVPGVCQPPEMDEREREKEWAVVSQLADSAIEHLVEMRRTEGRQLRDHLLENCDAIRAQLQAIAEKAPRVVDEYRKRLQTRVNGLLAEAKLELQADTLTREVAVYADRCDISEEMSRLKSHLDQFVQLCDRDENAGRRLDFLTQEMLRESNTIGSKANDAQISRCVVEIKSCVDRLREQVQNVE